ncbi:NUDIX domain-containing protein [Bacillus sp. AK128]
MSSKRGNVWLAVAGLVVNDAGEWLVVKKKYGGLKGMWSIPAGFVEANETIDQAVLREVKEETGISCTVQGILGVRSGVIDNRISDNMIIFSLKMVGNQKIITQEDELFEAIFKSPEQLKVDDRTSVLLRYYMEMQENQLTSINDTINPGNQFGYTAYKLFY